MSRVKNAAIIICGLRFPENAGMAARACANMGCSDLRLVKPENFSLLKAWPLASGIGRQVLEKIRIFDSISEAAADLISLYGSSARLGARRGRIMSPAQFAAYVAGNFKPGNDGEKLFGLLFGPEDRGLSNEELALCESLIHIPTASNASSLNLAQAILIILYELSKKEPLQAIMGDPSDNQESSVKMAELELLENALKEMLIRLESLPEDNSDYFFSHWRRMLGRMRLKRNEFDAFMGMCRQFNNKYGK